LIANEKPELLGFIKELNFPCEFFLGHISYYVLFKKCRTSLGRLFLGWNHLRRGWGRPSRHYRGRHLDDKKRRHAGLVEEARVIHIVLVHVIRCTIGFILSVHPVL
jgi:hypothetical protein